MYSTSNDNTKKKYQYNGGQFKERMTSSYILHKLQIIEIDDFIDEFQYNTYFDKLEEHLKKQNSLFSFLYKHDIDDYNKTVEVLMGVEDDYLSLYKKIEQYTKHLKYNPQDLDPKLNSLIDDQIEYIFKSKIERYSKLFNMLGRPNSMIKDPHEHMESLLLMPNHHHLNF